MKEFSITIGGRERRLRFTSRDAIDLYKAFGKPLVELVKYDLVGLDDENKQMRTTRPDVQIAFLHRGLRHDNPRLTEDQVIDWVDRHLEAGLDIEELTVPAGKAAYYSGIVFGKRVDVDAEADRLAEQNGGGKASTGETDPETAAPTIPADE